MVSPSHSNSGCLFGVVRLLEGDPPSQSKVGLVFIRLSSAVVILYVGLLHKIAKKYIEGFDFTANKCLNHVKTFARHCEI